jgi:hypothetical protein
MPRWRNSRRRLCRGWRISAQHSLQFAAPAKATYILPAVGNPNREITFFLTRCRESSFETTAKTSPQKF